MTKDILVDAMQDVIKDIQEEGCTADGITYAVLVMTLLLKRADDLEKEREEKE